MRPTPQPMAADAPEVAATPAGPRPAAVLPDGAGPTAAPADEAEARAADLRAERAAPVSVPTAEPHGRAEGAEEAGATDVVAVHAAEPRGRAEAAGAAESRAEADGTGATAADVAGARRRPVAREVRLARAWLTRAVEPGRASVVELVDRVGPVEAMHRIREGTAAARAAGFAASRRTEDRAEADLAAAQALGGRLVTPEDDEWPDVALHPLRLAFAREQQFGRPREERVSLAPPLALWAWGPLPVAEALARSVSVVGSRSATPYGEHVAGTLGHGLARRRWTVVSGGAYGIDGAAHRGALAAGGTTVAIVAGGFASPYPSGHAALFDRIRRDGLLLSEWPPDAAPHRHRFLVRNRLIAGLTAGTVLVEAGLRSGALATARQALRAGRPVMAMPGPVTSAESAGVHQFLRDRAEEVRLVTRTEEVIELIGAIGDDLAEPPTAPRRPRDGLDPVSLRVLDGLPATGAASPDRIAAEADIPPMEVLRRLPGLELRGLVESTPAGWILTRIARSP